MSFSTEFWIQMIFYAISIGSLAGTVLTRLKYIEKKQDKHNNFIERLTVVEESTKSAHKRLNEIIERVGD